MAPFFNYVGGGGGRQLKSDFFSVDSLQPYMLRLFCRLEFVDTVRQFPPRTTGSNRTPSREGLYRVPAPH